MVNRCPDVRVEGWDRNGEAVDETVRGISAGTFQHEDDHLNGILYTDIVTDVKSLCTWGEFERRFEGDFRESVHKIEARYAS